MNHNVSGTSTLKATHEAGATGIPMAVLALHSKVGNEDITAIAKGNIIIITAAMASTRCLILQPPE